VIVLNEQKQGTDGFNIDTEPAFANIFAKMRKKLQKYFSLIVQQSNARNSCKPQKHSLPFAISFHFFHWLRTARNQAAGGLRTSDSKLQMSPTSQWIPALFGLRSCSSQDYW